MLTAYAVRMAKFEPGTPDPSGTTEQGTQFSALPSGVNQFQRHPNNLRSTVPAYVQMNNSIVELDAEYDTLSSATKLQWELAVGDFSAVTVCACGGLGIDAKKLFRLVNYARQHIGLTPVTIPPGLITLPPVNLAQIERVPGLPAPSTQVRYFVDPTSPSIWLVCNLGEGNGNEWVYIDASTNTYVALPGEQLFDSVAPLPQGKLVSWCIFDVLGNPMGAGKTPAL